MADEKTPLGTAPAMADEKAAKGPKVWQYVGPKPAPLISNLPIDFKQPRLGTHAEKYPANELPEKFIEYVMRTNSAAKNWWK